MNVLQVTPTDVYPPAGGGPLRSHGIVSAFPGLGDPVFRYCQGGPLENYAELRFRSQTTIAPRYVEYRHLNPVFDALRLPEAFDLPNVFIQHALPLLAPAPLRRRLDWADVVLVEHPWQVDAIAEMAGETPVVYSSHNVETERFASSFDGAVGRWFTRRVADTERRALERSAATICTSERDARAFERRFGVTSRTILAPNGVSADKLSDRLSRTGTGDRLRERLGIDEDSFVGLFVGTAYPPNVRAAEAILDFADEAGAAGLDFHAVIVGSVGNAVGDHPTVTTTGFVEELEPFFDAADVCLNPVDQGSGTNIKLLDYFARRQPTITTPFGARGFDVRDGRETVVAPVEEFVDAIAALRDDERLRRRLGTNAQAFVREHHTWERISEHLNADLRELVDDGR